MNKKEKNGLIADSNNPVNTDNNVEKIELPTFSPSGFDKSIDFSGVDEENSSNLRELRSDENDHQIHSKSPKGSKVQASTFCWDIGKVNNPYELSTFSKDLYRGMLPRLLRQSVSPYKDPFNKDVALLSSIAFCSGIFPSVYANYGGFQHHANQFLFLVSPSSSGKSTLQVGEYLIEPIEDEFDRQFWKGMLERHPNRIESADENAIISQKTHQKRLILPANASIAAFMKELNSNNGVGIAFTTEGDIIGTLFKNDWGNMSAQWRCAWDHQKIDMGRMTESYSIYHPKLSIILSGTPNQVVPIIPNNEDGLHARFLYYCNAGERKWKSPFRFGDFNVKDYFLKLGAKALLPIWKYYLHKEVRFTLTKNQQVEMDRRFNDLLESTKSIYPPSTDSVVFRGGANFHRITMVLTILRNPKPGSEIVCNDHDFEAAFIIMRTLIQHGIYMTRVKPSLRNPKAVNLHSNLPSGKISTRAIYEIGDSLKFAESTTKRVRAELINAGYLQKLDHGLYQKVDTP